MRASSPTTLAVIGLLTAPLAAAQNLGTYRSNTVDRPAATAIPPADAPGGAGSLRATTQLVGWLPGEPSRAVSDGNVASTAIQLAPAQTADPDLGLYLDLSGIEHPQPIRGTADGEAPTDPGPTTPEMDRLNSDVYAPPGTDSGSMPQLQWPLGLSHNRHGLKNAGWARQQNTAQLPAAGAMAGVDMRLEPSAYRELHWHKASEWALMLRGSARIAAVDAYGRSQVDDLVEGDVWFFPPGVPHSIQAGADGCEFLLVFDDGSFSEDGTFLVSEMFERMPKSVLAKNFRTDVSAFNNLPKGELYIFPGTAFPEDIEKQNVTGPAGTVPQGGQYTYHWSQQDPYRVPGGTVKFLDTVTFPVAENFAVALVTLEPGAMRELHWHLTSDEWNYFLQGQGRITVYGAPDASATFDYTAGDVGYIPVPDAHYIENTGNETLVFLEVLLAPRFEDISVSQWLGLTPKQVVQDHLHLDDGLADRLPKDEQIIAPGNKDLRTTNFTDTAVSS